MEIWIEEIWLKHTQPECKRLGFENSLLSIDSFAAHLMESKLIYWKVTLLSGQYQLVVPRNANQWMLALTNHLKPY